MSNFEYYGTMFAFGAGLLLLAYLFKIRAKLIRKIKLRILLAKAKEHYQYVRPAVDNNEPLDFDETIDFIEETYKQDNDPWGRESSKKRDLR